jgi:hypothetical protein
MDSASVSPQKELSMLCRHCGKIPPSRPRGLCWSCYYKPGVRDSYPSTSKFARRGPGNFNGQPELLPVPTRALPGTAEKVAVLEGRVSRHQSLWHPLDAPSDCEAPLVGAAG